MTKVIGINKDVNYESIRIEQDDEIIFTFLGNYKFFLAHGKAGLDAFLLYSHLQFTARLQHTSSVKATNTYLMTGLRWNEKKVKSAKSFLHKHGFIQYKQDRGENNQFTDVYIVVKMSLEPVGKKAALADHGTRGFARQMLNPKTKCYTAGKQSAMRAPKEYEEAPDRV